MFLQYVDQIFAVSDYVEVELNSPKLIILIF